MTSASVQEVRGTNDKKNQHDKSNSNNWRTADNKKKGRRPDDPCFLRNHSGHTNKECSVQKLNTLKDSGRAAKPKYDKHGDKICDFVLNRIKYPFGHGCRESHKVNEARAYRAAATASPDTDSSDERRPVARKRQKRSKRRRNIVVARATNRHQILPQVHRRPRIFCKGDHTPGTKEIY